MQKFHLREEQCGEHLDIIEKRWGQIEDAIYIERMERVQDLDNLNHRLEERQGIASHLQHAKATVMGGNLGQLQSEAEEIERRLREIQSRSPMFIEEHRTYKEQWLGKYNRQGETFCRDLSECSKQKLAEITNKFDSCGEKSLFATIQTSRRLRQQISKDIQYMQAQKQRQSDLLGQMDQKVNSQMDRLTQLMRESACARSGAQNKLQIMICELQAELKHMIDFQSKQGEMTYDCLLKLIQDSCGKIQQAHLR